MNPISIHPIYNRIQNIIRFQKSPYVSVQFIVISLIQGICEYHNSVEITKIKDLFNLLTIWEYHFCKIMFTIVSQCHRHVPLFHALTPKETRQIGYTIGMIYVGCHFPLTLFVHVSSIW